jgi:hypothetical protein
MSLMMPMNVCQLGTAFNLAELMPKMTVQNSPEKSACRRNECRRLGNQRNSRSIVGTYESLSKSINSVSAASHHSVSVAA